MLQIAVYSDPGGRKENEDSVRFLRQGQDSLCLIVADGLGGHGGGKTASSAAVEAVCAGWSGDADPSDLAERIAQAHQAVRKRQTPDCTMKSTAVVLAVHGTDAAWAHVGDSRLYHFFQGRLDFQTRDHSASQVAVMLGEITPDQIRFHEDRSRILRALGQEGDLHAETGSRTLAPGRHAFLLCSDGFWEYVLEAEMESELRAAKTPQEWLDAMRDRLSRRASADNDNNTAAAVWIDI